MRRSFTKKFLQSFMLFSFLFIYGNTSAESPLITITSEMTPPPWALAERALLEENARFLELFTDKYIDPHTGYLECVETW